MIRYNKDIQHVQKIKEALIKNEFYCPCRIEKTSDTKCPCKEFREQEVGLCHCGLYEKVN